MDDRVRAHANTLVTWSARVEPGDNVVLNVSEGTHDLAVAVAAELGAVGATLLTTYHSNEMSRAYLRSHDGDFDGNDPEVAMLEAADVYLSLMGGWNKATYADVPGETRQQFSRANVDAREAKHDTGGILTIHPTRALAQQAGMSFEAYQDFVYDAVLRDWKALAEEMDRMKDYFDEGSEVRLVGTGTDLTMSIADRTAVNSAASVAYDSHNLPSGEVFTAPSATEGVITFDVPRSYRGQEIHGLQLHFEDGEVVDYDAERGTDMIESILETDDEARRLGELGVGMNRGIDRVTDHILFDEKMAGTVHVALGRAYKSCFPEGETGNQSAVHVDLITDLREEGRMEVDGEVILRNGVFRWEDGFEDW